MTTLSVPSDRSLHFIRKTEDLDTNSSVVGLESKRLSGLAENKNSHLVCSQISSKPIKSENEEFQCLICRLVLYSSHDFSLHALSHNSIVDTGVSSNKAKFSCMFSPKMLGSANSLDHHILIHTGERPFKCKYCNLTFTTNGNMQRHERVNHRSQILNLSNEDYWSNDSNGSVDSYNDHNYRESPESNDRKRKFSDTEFNNNSSNTVDNNNFIQKYNKFTSHHLSNFSCPVCHRDESSIQTLELHIAEVHPEYQARCEHCNLLFQNHHFLNLHVYMVHHRDHLLKVFSGRKISIPDLAGLIQESRISSEKNVTNSLNGTSHDFKCEKCFSEFSDSSELEIHHQICTSSDADCSSNENYSATDLSSVNSKRKHSESSAEEERKREEFFNGLDLKTVRHTPNESVTNGVENKDLADIQSIITITSTTHLITDLSKSPEPNSVEVSPVDSGCGEEEQQDCFAAEFRKMKLRGEFPCRLCPSIFPNLRALKGHNRVHLVSCLGSLKSPYRCNMCPHSSTDKSALLRHMRTHNGDRPYECSICRYAFTTKANCERHLRNRHSKMTREDVKRAIIYHPSEDPTNDISEESYYSKDEIKKSLFPDSTNTLKSRIRVSSVTSEKMKVSGPIESSESNNAVPCNIIPKNNSSFMNSSMKSSDWLDESIKMKALDASLKTSGDEEEEDEEEDIKPEEVELGATEETPLDLSVDVLDLSKKNQDLTASNTKDEEEPQDLSKKTADNVSKYDSSPNQSYFALTDLKMKDELMDKTEELLTSDTYRDKLMKMYDYENRPLVPTLPPTYHPYFFPAPILPIGFQPNVTNTQTCYQKEIFRGLQLNTRGVIDQIAMRTAAERFHAIQQQAVADYNKRVENVNTEGIKKLRENSPITVPNNNNINSSNSNSSTIENSAAKTQSNSSSSVKMVLKDGVLQAKPKQRRYRTERPFFCEHCSGRFTLRSNMERHIKQQHPQFWIQKQRGGSSGSRRGNPYNKIMPLVSGFSHTINHPSCYEEANHYAKSLPNFPHNNGLKSISDEVKVAISLQLKNKVISSEENAKYYADLKSDSSPDDVNCSDERIEKHNEDNRSSPEPEYQSHDNHDERGNEYYENEDEEDEELVIDEASVDNNENTATLNEEAEESRTDITIEGERSMKQKEDSGALDLASVSRLLDNASTQTFRQFFHDEEEHNHEFVSEEDEEGLVAGSEGNVSGSDENRSESEQNLRDTNAQPKKKSAYSLAPNRVFCPYCDRKFPWSSSLRRHILTHTGQKPYKCSYCPLLFTTKSNCDRHLLRKHGGQVPPAPSEVNPSENSDNQSFTMRNVPERPYKCIYCPSSTFASLQNLNKHLSSKHSEEKKLDDANSGYEESQGSGSEDIETAEKKCLPIDFHSSPDLPFKCYLCEGSYGERQEALDHIKSSHASEFQLLMSKGALDMSATSVSEEPPQNDEINNSEENLDQIKGKFPDYANRKVMCAFCLRRFWSAEDLRRHMRTHTGERPFSCDICRRKFTLKHSMLRHRKKHNKMCNSEEIFNSDDETPTPNSYNMNNNNTIINIPVSFWAKREQEGNDLISNLLGIHDKTIIDKMLLSKSAEDAARLLGVQK